MNGILFKISGIPALRIVMIGFLLAIFTQCSSMKAPTPSASAAYNPLLTPPHGMTKSQYPFDNKGNYRRDWVKSGSNARASSSTQTPEPIVNQYGARSNVSIPVANRTIQPARHPQSPPPPATAARRTPPPAPTSGTYHTVKSGDTLFAVGRKYGIPVPDLKRKNGLVSDTIRIGQSLRVR